MIKRLANYELFVMVAMMYIHIYIYICVYIYMYTLCLYLVSLMLSFSLGKYKKGDFFTFKDLLSTIVSRDYHHQSLSSSIPLLLGKSCTSSYRTSDELEGFFIILLVPGVPFFLPEDLSTERFSSPETLQEMTGKVIVDGPDEIRGPLEKILESERTFERDDRAVMTTLDTRSRFVFEWFFGHNGVYVEVQVWKFLWKFMSGM